MSSALLIECTIKRPGGTHVTIGGNAYHFRPEPGADNPAHVSVVADMGDVQKFMAVPEAYRLIGPVAAEPTPVIAPAPVVAPVTAAPAQPELVAAVAPTPAPSAQDKADAPVTADDLTTKSVEELQAIYAAEIGVKPHNRSGAAFLIEKITEARAAAAAAAAAGIQPLGATQSA